MKIVKFTEPDFRALQTKLGVDAIRGADVMSALNGEKVTEVEMPPHSTDDCAAEVLAKFKVLEPEKFMVAEDTMQSRGISTWRYVVGVLMRAGDNFHLGDPEWIEGDPSIPEMPLPPTQCLQCGEIFPVARKGQVYCSNLCGSNAEKARLNANSSAVRA